MGRDLESANRTVLLIEDDRDICESVSQVLEDEGYEVASAPNGLDGLGQLRSKQTTPFVILLDLMLPVMDAWQFRSEQQRDPELAAIPIVVFSANPKLAQHAATLGAAGVLRKPPDLDELVSVVARFRS